jgi:hypothetical protein
MPRQIPREAIVAPAPPPSAVDSEIMTYSDGWEEEPPAEEIYESGWVQPVVPPDLFGMVTNGKGDEVPFGIDRVIYMAISEAMEIKKAEWLVELSGLKPGKAVCFAASMVRAVESLGY